jgi:hypothetical protein
MSDRLGDIVAGVGQTNVAPVTPYEAIIDNTVTTIGQDLFVIIPSLDGGRTTKGPLRWAPLPGPSGQVVFPTKGDLAQVVRTNEGYYWLNKFVPAVYPSDTNIASRVAALETWQAGSKGFARVVDTDSDASPNAANTGWTWQSSGQLDSAFFQIGTPPGTPGGIAAASNSGLKVLQSGFYRINAQVLCQSATAGGRYDAYLHILNTSGVITFRLDEYLVNQPAGVGAAHVKFPLSAEWLLTANQWIWPHNISAPTYGDSTGGWSHLTARYMGT